MIQVILTWGKETDGIGTAATQAGIIQELIDGGMLIKKGKHLISSTAARNLIHALPENITLPDLTAIWETYFRKVKASEMSIDEVINYIQDTIREIIASAQPITVQSFDNGLLKSLTARNLLRKVPSNVLVAVRLCSYATARMAHSGAVLIIQIAK